MQECHLKVWLLDPFNLNILAFTVLMHFIVLGMLSKILSKQASSKIVDFSSPPLFFED